MDEKRKRGVIYLTAFFVSFVLMTFFLDDNSIGKQLENKPSSLVNSFLSQPLSL